MNKKLVRSLEDRKIAGVCGGIAEYFELDSTIIRLGFVFLALIFGGGLIAYLISWLVIPEKSEQYQNSDVHVIRQDFHDKKLYRSRTNRSIAGVCGGLAEYLSLDVTLIRFAMVILAFVFGGGILAYLIGWMIIPEEPY